MNDEKLVQISTFANPVAAEIVKAALAAESIPCLIDNELQAGLAGALPIKLMVREQDAERAKAILDEHIPLPDDVDVGQPEDE